MFKENLRINKPDGTVETVEANIMLLGWRQVKKLKRKYLVVNRIVPEGTGIKAMEGVFDYEGISEEAFDIGVKCNNKEEVDPFEIDRIYNKYYAKYFNPNHISGDEEKNPRGVELDSEGDDNQEQLPSNNSGNTGAL